MLLASYPVLLGFVCRMLRMSWLLNVADMSFATGSEPDMFRPRADQQTLLPASVMHLGWVNTYWTVFLRKVDCRSMHVSTSMSYVSPKFSSHTPLSCVRAGRNPPASAMLTRTILCDIPGHRSSSNIRSCAKFRRNCLVFLTRAIKLPTKSSNIIQRICV